MRGFAIAAAVFCLVVLVAPARGASSDPVVRKIDRVRAAAQMCQGELTGGRRWPVAHLERRASTGPELRLWVLELWRERHAVACAKRNALNAWPPNAVRFVFGRLGADDVAIALDVIDDEGGGPQCVRATNGQYLGCFQMGAWARDQYGHGRTALLQAWAAFRYRVAARGWCSGWAATANVCPGAIR